MAEIPLIYYRGGGADKRRPPDQIVRPFLGEPPSEVSTVDLECPPVGELSIVLAALRLGDVVMDGLPVDGYRFDGEGSLCLKPLVSPCLSTPAL